MQPPTRIALTLVSLAAAGLLGSGAQSETRLHAASSGLQPLVDTDGDGLHDLAEIRLGTLIGVADTDGDGVSDLEEFLCGRDPLVAQPLSTDPPDASLILNLYESAGILYVQGHALFRNRIFDPRLGLVTEHLEMWGGAVSIRPWLRQQQILPSSAPGAQIHTFTIAFPSSLIEDLLPGSLILIAKVDGEYLGDKIRLVNISDEVMELRTLRGADQSGNGQNPGGNSPGGLFPADPTTPNLIEVAGSEVCVQVLGLTGSLQGYRRVYKVRDAYCDFMPGAICFQDCSMSVGDTVVGYDLPGLLGDLNQ